MASKCVLVSALFLHITLFVHGDSESRCIFPKHQSKEFKNGEKQLAPLMGKRFSATDPDNKYRYNIGICAEALDPAPEGYQQGTGVLQVSKEDSSYKVVGQYLEADILAGPDWVMLEYNKGDTYGSHCIGKDGPEQRRARIMFICDRASHETQPVVLEEQNNKTDSCYYLFEFTTSAVCPARPLITFGLSIGSVLLIVFFSVLAFYLIAGCVYNRFVRGAKGIQQIPNLSFWEDFGNLEADGCDLVCRSGRSREPKTYKGIGDDQLNEVEERTDDHLLPM